MHVFSNRLQMMSKCGQKKKKKHTRHSWVSQMFLHILMSSVIFHYWTDPWQHGISLLYKIKEQNIVNGDTIYASFLQKIISKNKWKCKNNSAYHIMSFWGQITSFVRQKNPITVTSTFGKDCNITLQKLPLIKISLKRAKNFIKLKL